IDEIRVWSAARSAAQLGTDRRRPLRGDEDGLVGLWRLDEGAGTEIFDAGPNHLDGSASLAAAGAGPAPQAFTASGAWRAREVWEERAMDPADAGYDADGDPLTLTLSAPPTHGTGGVDQDRL